MIIIAKKSEDTMYKSDVLQGKKLVVLGGAANESTLVKRAQELGVYVIVADYYTDLKLSPAKSYADEAWDVNWTNVDEMVRLCEENNVDGITAGYSEVKIDYLIRICERLGLPCYCSKEQLDITRDKKKFKQKCRECGVPVVREYESIYDVDHYPVIIKPVDRAGSVGIGVAHNYNELIRAYNYAIDKSFSKEVVIEDYITDQKVDVYYLVNNGEISLLTNNDVIMAAGNGSNRVVQSCWLYPQRYIDSFTEKVDASLRKMISSMGIKYGCIFFSGFVNSEKEYTFFECGFRLEGAHQYNYTYNSGSVNFLDVFIAHALTGSIDCVKNNPAGDPTLKLAIINIYAKAGTICSISGADKISKMRDCSLSLVKANVGDICKDDAAILTKIAMFEFNNSRPTELSKDIHQAYSLFECRDEHGNDLVYDRINPEIVEHWWNAI